MDFGRGAFLGPEDEVGRLCRQSCGGARPRAADVRAPPARAERAARRVREHLETFLAEARERGGGDGVPAFVERELREFLTCGVMARGFAVPQ